MLLSQRKQEIMELLKEKRSISVQALIELLPVSPATIRRYIVSLEKDGLIRRTRTGDNRKYYILMPEGERTLQNEYERIKKQAADMERVLQKEEES